LVDFYFLKKRSQLHSVFKLTVPKCIVLFSFIISVLSITF